MELLLNPQACDFYYETYSHYGQHEALLQDELRLSRYDRAFQANAEFIKGKVVLDAGTGTGILAMMAAKIGAKKVYAVEKTIMAEFAKKIIELNHYDDVVTVIHADLNSVELPEKVDVMILSGFGPCLFYDSSFEGIINSRNKFLKPDGIMLPGQGSIVAAGITDDSYLQQRLSYWDDVYGFDFKALKSLAKHEPLNDAFSTKKLCTEDVEIAVFNFKMLTHTETNFTSRFTIKLSRNCLLSGLLVWFTLTFNTGKRYTFLSSSPFNRDNYWGQSIFYFDKSINCSRNDEIECIFSLKQDEISKKNYDSSLDLTLPDTFSPKQLHFNYQFVF